MYRDGSDDVSVNWMEGGRNVPPPINIFIDAKF